MNKEFIPYEQALELKELGFDELSLDAYYKTTDGGVSLVRFPDEERQINYPFERIPAPLYQQAFRWFRENYNWQHSIQATSDQHRSELGYNYWIWNNKTGEEHYTMPKNRPIGDWEYETYEEAELSCLNELIEIIKNK